jgi:hypothetical protein
MDGVLGTFALDLRYAARDLLRNRTFAVGSQKGVGESNQELTAGGYGRYDQ